MATLRFAPETLIGRLLPGVEGVVEAVTFDRHGDVVLTLSGPGVPETDGEVEALIFASEPPLKERVELRLRKS